MANRKGRPNMDQQKAYGKAFDHLNKRLFKGALSTPMLVLSRNKNLTTGVFNPEKWIDDTGNQLHEIILSAGITNLKDFYMAMVHQMLHQWQNDHGAPSENGYHNKEWTSKAVEIGLKVKGYGYKIDTIVKRNGAFDKALKSMPEDASFPLIVEKKRPTKKEKLSTSGKRVKYECPECLSRVWGKAGINIQCIDCLQRFIEV